MEKHTVYNFNEDYEGIFIEAVCELLEIEDKQSFTGEELDKISEALETKIAETNIGELIAIAQCYLNVLELIREE